MKSEPKGGKKRVVLLMLSYKIDWLFEIILEVSRTMSESEYELDQEGSEEDYDADEIARPKLRPHNRNK